MRPPQHANPLPGLKLISGPARSGKTAECLRRLRAGGPDAVLVGPSAAHAIHLKDRLRRGADEPYEGRCTTLTDLAGGIVGPEAAGRRISHSVQRMALAGIVEEQCLGDSYFARMREAPGFPAALAACIRELKLAGVEPLDFDLAAGPYTQPDHDPTLGRKLDALSHLYAAYEEFLGRHDLHDEEDLPRLAAERVAVSTDLPAVVILDGLLRVAPAWMAFLAALAGRGAQVVMTLLDAPDRPLLFASSARAREALTHWFAVEDVEVAAVGSVGCSPTLAALERGLFSRSAAAARAVPDSPAPPLLLMDAPGPMMESEMAVREIRREHDERGVPWDECAIIVRTIPQYQAALEVAAARYGVPLFFHSERQLTLDPVVRALSSLLAVFAHDWKRDDVVTYLRSGLSGAPKLAVDHLRLRASRAAIRHGRPAWERLAARLDGEGDPVHTALAQMLDWDRRLRAQPRTVPEYGALVGALAEALAGPPTDDDEHAALRQALRITRDLGRVTTLTGDGRAVPFSAYHRLLAATWDGASYALAPRPNCVDVLEPYDARQTHPRTAVVMGLTERAFPRRITEDPFLRDDERAAVAEATGRSLEPHLGRTDDERLLFYLAVTAPTERLVLTWPRSDEQSDALRSFYVDEVCALFDHVPARVRTLADVAPRDDECVNDRDRLLGTCARGSAGSEHVRATLLKPPAHRLDDGTARSRYAGARRYSVTEIETYGRCPLQHALRHGLDLRRHPQGIPAARAGTILHTVLRRYHRLHAADDPPPTADEMREGLLAELRTCMSEQVLDAPPHRVQMLERFLEDTLTVFADREAQCRDLFAIVPRHCELAFGTAPDAAVQDDDVDDTPETGAQGREYDAESRPEPLVIAGGGCAPDIALCGAIDRVDLRPGTACAVALDYKSGKPPAYAEMREGRSLQLVCYLLALERLWGYVGGAACYDSPRSTGRPRIFRVDCVDPRRFAPTPGQDGRELKPLQASEFGELVRAVEDTIRAAAAGISACAVLPRPGEHCAYCDFPDVCRTGRDGGHDGEPLPTV